MAQHTDPFAPAVYTAHGWLARIAQGIGTDDRAFAYQLTRAWLHAVRDRLDVPAAVHLGAQLPELLRGVYYDGWKPARVPVGRHPQEFIDQVAADAHIAEAEVPVMVGLVTDALEDLFSPGQLAHVFAVLPDSLVGVLSGEAPPEHRLETRGDDAVVAETVEIAE